MSFGQIGRITRKRLENKTRDNFRVQVYLPDLRFQAVCYLFLYHINKPRAEKLRDSYGLAIQQLIESEFLDVLLNTNDGERLLKEFLDQFCDQDVRPEINRWVANLMNNSLAVDKPV